jgi:hypothetical protein
MSAIGDLKNGDSQIASTPSDAMCPMRCVTPLRSPPPSPVVSWKERG